jgi:rhomboid protease GluP
MMESGDGFEVGAGSWEVFALAAIAPLGPFPGVHLAPKLPPALLNSALGTYLSLERDELLLALVDGGASKPAGCCALTTRRIYWVQEKNGGEPARGAAAAAPRRARTRGRSLIGQAAGYEGLPPTIQEFAAGNGSLGLDLGGGRTLVLRHANAPFTQTLARFLETMGKAARSGVSPSLSAIDGQLAGRILRALPAIVSVTSRARALNQDLLEFRTALHAATPRVVMTYAFILGCVAVFAVMALSGVPLLWPSGADLVRWGANQGIGIVLRHEYWRLLASVFVHGGLIHLAVNMWSLFVIGPLVERLYGNWAFGVLYVAAGLGGALASVAASPMRIGVGASGAICGVLGALVAFLITHRRSLPVSLLKSLRASVLGIVIFMAMMGFVVPNIDQEAHFGGLATGFVSGLLLTRPLSRFSGRWVFARRIVASLLLAGALAGAAVGVARRGLAAVPPSVRWQETRLQFAPIVDEFNAIDQAIPGTMILSRDRGDPAERKQHLERVQVLAGRAALNLARLRKVTVPDAGLRRVVEALIRAQDSQLGELAASRRYLDSGKNDDLAGPDGVLSRKAGTTAAIRSFQKDQRDYLSTHGMLAKGAGTERRPTPLDDE